MDRAPVGAAPTVAQAKELAAAWAAPVVRKRPSKAERMQTEDGIIAQAMAILARRMTAREVFSSPSAVKQYLELRLARSPVELFSVCFLDAQNRLIECRELFRGTLTQTSVYPREVVRECLELHAAAVVLAHNHPSGTVQPSRADEALTQTLKAALALVDVRVLDHIIVAPGQSLSMAEKGLI